MGAMDFKAATPCAPMGRSYGKPIGDKPTAARRFPPAML